MPVAGGACYNLGGGMGRASGGSGSVIECHAGTCTYLRFERLSQEPAIVHGVFTRHGGVSAPPFASLNASVATGDDPAAVANNREIIAGALELPLASARPVHGARVVEVTSRSSKSPASGTRRWRSLADEADAMMTDEPGLGLFWAFADCVPLILFDPAHRAVALVHAGWRGTAQAIAARAVRAMRARYGSRPADLLAGVAPAIGKCCYRVSHEVRACFDATPEARDTACFERRGEPEGDAASRPVYLDLWESNRRQLLAAGLASDHIELAGLCTGCRTDLFYSHRIESKPTGRFGVAVGLAPA